MSGKTVVWIGVSVMALAGVAFGAAANTTWDKKHPRQHQVVQHANAQARQNHKAFQQGKVTGAQARRLSREDSAIKREDRSDATVNGGFITKGQKVHMHGQLKAVGKQRSHDEKADAHAK